MQENSVDSSDQVEVAPNARHPHPSWQSAQVSAFFLFPSAIRRNPSVEAWFAGPDDAPRLFVQPWFEQMLGCGGDVRELLHDGHPTACVGEAAFAYVDAFTAHGSVGFYEGASLDDPAGLLEGAGKRMRHVKLRWGRDVNAIALGALIVAAYRDMQARLEAES